MRVDTKKWALERANVWERVVEYLGQYPSDMLLDMSNGSGDWETETLCFGCAMDNMFKKEKSLEAQYLRGGQSLAVELGFDDLQALIEFYNQRPDLWGNVK